MGDALLVILPALILAAVLWAGATALKPRDSGMSDAERYQRELAARSQAHDAAQAKAATAARARIDAATRPAPQRELQPPVRNGQKDQAARLLRQATPTDLLTAKNYVDRL